MIGCGQSGKSKVVGEWKCTEHYSESMVGKASITLKEDGTSILNPMNIKGTYEVEGNKVTIYNDTFGENGLEFQLKGNKLVIESDVADTVYEKQ